MIGFISTLSRRVNYAHSSLKWLCAAIFFTLAYILYYSVVTDIIVQHNTTLRFTHFVSPRIQSNHFIYYPGSRGFEEMEQIGLISLNPVNIIQSIWNHFHKYDFPSQNASSTGRSIAKNGHLPFSEILFQRVDFPVLWLDTFGDVHWNVAAEKEIYAYLIQKQFPPLETSTASKDLIETYIQDCHMQQLLILEQWRHGGFLSRLNCLIDQFGQSLYTPSMAVLSPEKFNTKSAVEDYLEEGIVGYISPISRCSAYLHHPAMSDIKEGICNIASNVSQKTQFLRIEKFKQLRQYSNKSFLYLSDIWKFGYEHVPHRRWLFDFDRKQAMNSVNYDSSSNILTRHDKEHIYVATNRGFNLLTWQPNNSPFILTNEGLRTDYIVTWKDKVFTSFIRYMITLYVHNFPPRIQLSTKLLTLHWTKYLGDKYRRPYNSIFTDMAGIFIRRGDKMVEDSFWKKYQHWRNISYYVKGLVDEEKRRNKTFSSIFIMTDDASVMNSILEYATTKSKSSDELYSRQHLYGRQIVYNVFAPQSCFDPFIRIGFDQFLVNLNFLVEHASFIVSHTDSNVGRYLERLIYAKRQFAGNKTYRTTDFVKNAPDSFG